MFTGFWRSALAAVVAVGFGAASAATAQDATKVSIDDKGFRVRSADGAFALKLGFRMHADATWHGTSLDDGFKTTNGTEIRRGRIEATGTLFEDWGWAGAYEFADDQAAVKDLFVSYKGIDRLLVTVGNQKQPYSLEVEMSSNDLPFVERGVDSVLTFSFVDRAIGVRLDGYGDHWFAAGGFYGQGISPPSTSGIDEGYGATGRFIVAPIIEPTQLVHLGFRSAYRSRLRQDGASSVQLRDETTHMSSLRVVDTGVITGARNALLYGPEFAVACGPFSLFGEYNRTRIAIAGGGGDLDLNSGHIAATWSLTGESRAASYTIESGEFKALKPAENFSLKKGGIGAFELAARYSYLDLTDGGFVGGENQVFSAALNWYANPNVRLMFDWSFVIDVDGGSPLGAGAAGTAADNLSAFTARAQFAF